MFISGNKHVLSSALKKVAFINLLIAFGNAGTRYIMKRRSGASPDMLNGAYWKVQLVMYALQLLLVLVIFLKAYDQLAHIRSAVEREDFSEMAKLQEEVLGDKISRLSSYSILQLLKLWGVILIGVEGIYDVFSIIYRQLVADMTAQFNMTDPSAAQAFVDIYNYSHGFKYIGILVAIALGILTTGIFLHDRYLELSAVALTLLFAAAVLFLEMQTVTILGRTIGVVWSSVIFHLMETIGLYLLATYLSRRYRGI